MIAQYAAFAMAAILIVATLIELRSGRIPNWLTALPVVVFVAVAISDADWLALSWQIGLAVAVLLFGLLLFVVAGIGAGAVKLMAGVALFVPLDKAFAAFLILIGTFFVSAFIVVQLRKAIGSQDSNWHWLANAVLPMTIPIAAAGFAVLFLL